MNVEPEFPVPDEELPAEVEEDQTAAKYVTLASIALGALGLIGAFALRK